MSCSGVHFGCCARKPLICAKFISRGRNVSEYFPHVVKNVASQNVEVRKLVYIYLLRHAQNEPDLALLSINTFQKDLTDPNPVIRAVALRVLSGIKVPMIASLVVLAIKKCAVDTSPYVRTGAALAILKCCRLDSGNLPGLIEVVSTLLRDRSPLSIGSVAVAFESICPARLDLLHHHYRQLCKILVDVDEWGQVHLLSLLTRYARAMLPRPAVDRDALNPKEHVDADLQLLLTSSEPLLQSRNPAVSCSSS
jgi:AP-3 complex subunit beta